MKRKFAILEIPLKAIERFLNILNTKNIDAFCYIDYNGEKIFPEDITIVGATMDSERDILRLKIYSEKFRDTYEFGQIEILMDVWHSIENPFTFKERIRDELAKSP